jgi:GTPase SAR1 family protein
MTETTEAKNDVYTERMQKAVLCRQELLNFMTAMPQKGAKFDLPKPFETFREAQNRLNDNTYHVIVVGEAKRGKSSFTNALIGQPLLPTDVDVSTAQVFRVKNAEKEAFRLRFEDGSVQEITREELYKFGSQKAYDENQTGNNVFGGKILHWIEVDLPAKFLPEGVCLLDTPGTGALNAAHAEITQRFIPMADAVIFVLDSEQPVLQEELNFIDRILQVTPNIFFVQTKIDRFDTPAWQAILQRNEEILAQKVEEWKEKNIPDPEQRKHFQISTKIWPISNGNMIKAASMPANYQATMMGISRFPEMEKALNAFLFQVAGLRRSLLAEYEAEKCYKMGANVLMSRLNNLANSDGQSDRQAQALRDREQNIRTQLAEQGQKLKLFKDDLYQQSDAVRRNMVQIFQIRDHAWDDLRSQIQATRDIDGFKKLEEMIPGEVARIAGEECQNLMKAYEMRIAEFRQSLTRDLDDLFIDPSSLPTINDMQNGLSDSTWDVVKGGYRDGAITYAITELLKHILVFIPGGPVIAVIATVWSFIHGWKSAQDQQTQRNQSSLLRYLDECIIAVRGHFLDVDVKAGLKRCRIDEILLNRQQQVVDALNAEFIQKQTELQKEIQHMEEQQKLDQAEREKAVKLARERMTEWSGLGRQLEGIWKMLQALTQPAA